MGIEKRNKKQNRTDLSKKEEVAMLHISLVTGDEREEGAKENSVEISQLHWVQY